MLLPQVKQIQQAIEGFISLDNQFKGEGAERIRSFYQECHLPLLLLLEGFMVDYRESVLDIQRSLRSFDPAEDAFIRQTYIQNDLMQGNQRIENIVKGLTDEANTIIQSISGIVTVPLLDQGEFLHDSQDTRRHMDDTTENLHTFDANSTARLDPLKSDLAVMQNYIAKITDLFQQNSVDIANYTVRSLSGYEFHQDLITAIRNKASETVFSADAVLEILGRSVLARFGSLPNVLLTAFQEKFQKRTLNYALRSMQTIGEASGKVLTQAEFDTLRHEVTNHVLVKDYQQEWDGIYLILKDGRKFRSYPGPNGTMKYALVDEIPPHRFKKATISKVEKKQSVWDNIVSGAGKTLSAAGTAGKEAADFLFLDDVNTLIDDEASGLDKALAAVSFIPIGKVVKLRKVNKLFENKDKVDAKKVGDGSGGTVNNNKKTGQPKTAEQIISNRTKGLDLNPHPIQQKQLSARKMKELRGKIENRTITKAEYEQYIWNKKFAKHRASGVSDFWYQERQRILNNETPTRDWNHEQLNDILNGKKPKVDGEIVQGHHSYSASQYPHLANKGEIIYPATPNEHLKGWHGGNWKKSLPGKPINPIDDF